MIASSVSPSIMVKKSSQMRHVHPRTVILGFARRRQIRLIGRIGGQISLGASVDSTSGKSHSKWVKSGGLGSVHLPVVRNLRILSGALPGGLDADLDGHASGFKKLPSAHLYSMMWWLWSPTTWRSCQLPGRRPKCRGRPPFRPRTIRGNLQARWRLKSS